MDRIDPSFVTLKGHSKDQFTIVCSTFLVSLLPNTPNRSLFYAITALVQWKQHTDPPSEVNVVAGRKKFESIEYNEKQEEKLEISKK